MSPQLSKAIFGIGIALSVASIAAVYVTMLATQNQNLNSQTDPASQQPVPTNSSTGSSTSTTTIAIPNGAAVQESSLNKEYYKPVNMKITSNSKVTWINQDIAAHTATSGQSIDSSDSGQVFDTGTIAPGSSGSAMITGSNEIPYHCTFHPWMLGILQITSAANSTDGNNTSIQS
ncbi:MAG: cupredoxin domain-containing protein [Nitrososphaeraceae archaeon]